MLVEAGVIPLTTPDILFGNAANFNPPSPNPFNPTTTFSFDLSVATKVRLVVYDILGRSVAVLANETLDVGNHKVIFDGSVLPTGVYFANLRAGSQVKTYKILLVR